VSSRSWLRATREEHRRSACEDVKCESAPIQEVRLEDLRRNTCSDRSASFCVQTENPGACATVNWNVCKSAIALYGLY
jgi:hypothetical protein